MNPEARSSRDRALHSCRHILIGIVKSSKLSKSCNDTPPKSRSVSDSYLLAARFVALPYPLKGFGHCLKLHALINVTRSLGENELVRISFGLQHGGHPVISNDPVA